MVLSGLLGGGTWDGVGVLDISPRALWFFFRTCSLILLTLAVLAVLPTDMLRTHSYHTVGSTRHPSGRRVLLAVYVGVLAAAAIVLLVLVFLSRYQVILGDNWILPEFRRRTSVYMAEMLGIVLLTGPAALWPPVPSGRWRAASLAGWPPGNSRQSTSRFLPWVVCLAALVIAWVYGLAVWWDRETILLHSIAACLGDVREGVRLSRMDAGRVAAFYRLGTGLCLGLTAICMVRQLASPRVACILDSAILPHSVVGPRQLARWAAWASSCVVAPVSLLFLAVPHAETQAISDELRQQFLNGTVGFMTAYLLLCLCAVLAPRWTGGGSGNWGQEDGAGSLPSPR
jgi:hypothetical protein